MKKGDLECLLIMEKSPRFRKVKKMEYCLNFMPQIIKYNVNVSNPINMKKKLSVSKISRRRKLNRI